MINDPTIIAFLLEIGRWAKSELSEIWKVRRKQQEADLTNSSQTTSNIPLMLGDILIERNEIEVDNIVSIIKRKHDAVLRAMNAKLADREELSRGEITQSMYEERLKKHDQTIQQMLEEIRGDLIILGLDLDRSPV